MLFFRYFKFYSRKFRGYFLTTVLALLLTDILDVIPALIIGRGVDQINENASIHELMKTALFFAGLTLSLAIVRFNWRMQSGKYHQNVALDLRERIFNKLTELGPRFFSENPIGELMSLMINDVEAVRMGMGPGFFILVDALFYLLMIPVIMFRLSVPLTLKCLVMLPFLPFFINWISGIVHRRYLKVQDAFSEMSGITQENITGIRVIKSYVQEENQIAIFNKSSGHWRDMNLDVAWTESFMQPVMEFCVTVGVVLLLYSGSKNVLSGTLTIGTFFVFRRYISQMVWPMTAIGWGFTLTSQGNASLDRIDKFLNIEPDVALVPVTAVGAPGATATALDLNGAIEVRGLTFSYPGSSREILKNISLTVKKGQTFGIVGPVGSGKTTLAQLLCHLFEVPRGTILVNGIDLRDIPLQTLRKHVSLVPQDTFLFSTSVGENMAFGVEADPALEALIRVAQIAKLDEEIDNLPQRYDTYLGERGVNLSGGQKQRMTITRALLRKSPVIIFDDSLSAVDAETESLILKRLREETREHTTIIISHRLSSLSLCDQIVVIKQGAIEAMGTSRELRETSITYRELLELQGYG